MNNKCDGKLLETVAFSNGCICSVELIQWEHTHFHPSGDLLPSTHDIEATETIANLCGMLGVKFYEHVIVGKEDQYYFFYENNMVPLPKKLVQGRMENINLGGIKVAETSTEYTSGKDYYEMKREELREITDKLEQGVAEIFSSDRYQEMLDMIARFPEYSANNSLLILLQRPNAQLTQNLQIKNLHNPKKNILSGPEENPKGISLHIRSVSLLSRERSHRKGQIR